MPVSTKCAVCNHPRIDEINQLLKDDVDYKDIIKAVEDEGLPLTTSGLSRHYKNHYAPDNVKALVWKNNQLCFQDGMPVTPISAIAFLEGVISLAARNITQQPHRVGPRDALIAVELLLKIRTGLDKLDEFEEAWTEFIKTGKHRLNKRIQKAEEEQKALTTDAEYVGFDTDDDDAPDE